MQKITRWAFLCTIAWTLAGCAMVEKRVEAKKKTDWKLAIQMYTFNRYTLFEGIDKANELDLKYIEAFAWQKVSKEHDTPLQAASPAVRQAVRDKLDEAGIEMINCYFQFAKQEASMRKQFEFCQEMGIQTAVGEPNPKALDLIEKLADEYEINVALHNHKKHPKDKNYIYWSPEKVMGVLNNRSKRIGTCADTGHWVRSNLDPIVSLKTYEPRQITLHLKDVDKLAPDAHDVIWTTGVGDIKGQLTELDRQGFVGVITIEYEANWENNIPDIRNCIAHYNRICAQLGR